MDDRTLYTEVARGLWRAALYYRTLPKDYRLYPHSPTNAECVIRLARSAAEIANLANNEEETNRDGQSDGV